MFENLKQCLQATPKTTPPPIADCAVSRLVTVVFEIGAGGSTRNVKARLAPGIPRSRMPRFAQGVVHVL